MKYKFVISCSGNISYNQKIIELQFRRISVFKVIKSESDECKQIVGKPRF